MDEPETPWQRFAGAGMYPVEYAGWLLNPVRWLIAPPGRIARRLHLAPTDRVLEAGCGPGWFSPTVARTLPRGHLTLFDAQPGMLELAAGRMRAAGLTNFSTVNGFAESLPFATGTFDVMFMVTVLGEVPDRAAAVAEAARVLRPGGIFSATEAAGDPDRMREGELNALAAQAGLEAAGRWPGWLISTFNYRKPQKAP